MQHLDKPRPEFGEFNEPKNCDIDVPKLNFLQDYFFIRLLYRIFTLISVNGLEVFWRSIVLHTTF